MDALKSISANVPEWLRKMDHLSAQIEQRQLDLAAFADSASMRAPSIRNRGSTESLKPKDENVDIPVTDAPDAPDAPDVASPVPMAAPPAPQTTTPLCAPEVPVATDATATNVATRQQQRAKPTVRRKQKSASVASINADGKPVAASRTRHMIIVYYDSFVQTFFEDLVKFVSVSRNYMRKAKMAAKVAQIKRMAEEEFDGDSDKGVPAFRLPPSRRFGPRGPGSGAPSMLSQFSDIYTQLDDHLEFVQTTSEKAAHQFLREGDCDNEISSIQSRLRTALEIAEKEMERLQKEAPEAVNAPEPISARTHRPPTMRHNKPKKSSDQLSAGNASPVPSGQASPKQMGSGSIIEAADDDDDEGIEADWQPPKIQFRSTRDMRGAPRGMREA